MKDLVFANGARIPKIGCGTWELRGEQCASAVRDALKIGYRHIDTAQGYENEDAVGDGIQAAGIQREAIFITTKVRPDRLRGGVLQRSVEESLRRLRLDCVDLLLIHWPNPEVPLTESMRALSDAKRMGLARNIGVSNFTIAMLGEAIRLSAEPLAVAQFEYHPYLDQRRLLAAVRKHGLAITAYCPIAMGKVAGDPALTAIGRRYGKSAVQIALRWLVQQEDVIAIPKSSKPERLKENLDVFDFELTGSEMAEIGSMTKPGSRLISESQWVPEWD